MAADAVWHGGRCNWITPVPLVTQDRATIAARSLSSDVYAGTAGVGLALAEVATATGDRECRDTAIGALRHSIARRATISPTSALGLYNGLPGIALAAIRGGRLLGAGDLVVAGGALAVEITARDLEAGGHDLVNGRAGTILGVLALAHALDEPGLVETALSVGETMIEEAQRQGRWAWTGAGPGTGLDPTGLAHGAAGASLALLELGDASGMDRYWQAAGMAMKDEDSLHDRDTGNWIDGGEASLRPGAAAQGSFIYWCHGAPGIALVRDRAWRLTGAPAHRTMAATALGVTARWVRASIDSGRGGFGLCHGLTGNAEILRDTADTAGDAEKEYGDLAAAAAAMIAEEYVHRGRPLPCGVPGGESPGLMTGLAGIARFYLRAADPSLPSILRLCPAEWMASAAGLKAPPAAPSRR